MIQTTIYASKLYRTSTRKSRIKAAIQNPMNVELVAQVAKSLDDEYQTDDYLLSEEDKEKKSEPDTSNSVPEGDLEDNADVEPSFDFTPHASSGGSSHRPTSSGGPKDEGSSDIDKLGSDKGVELDSDKSVENNAPSSKEPSKSESSPSNDAAKVSESVHISGQPIIASVDCSRDIVQVAEQIKGLLNFKDSTSGVLRTSVKEDEFWIYFNDNINLNNMMSNVIDTLNGSGYVYLEFNRLARSDNAMVFVINYYSEGIKPLEPIQEKDGVIKEVSE